MNKAYDSFRYADRLKSNLFFVMEAVDELSKLQGVELEGGRKIVRRGFERFRNELQISMKYLPEEELNWIGKKILEAEGNAMLCNYKATNSNLAEAMSKITTLANRYTSALKDKPI
ncbi:MAG: hypothetical protein QMD14_02405 [Candidatus Aenigmarchaeota archaeon]|nr:hypothetical protein [Candidatus Aenigmarchaeota archaeon]